MKIISAGDDEYAPLNYDEDLEFRARRLLAMFLNSGYTRDLFHLDKPCRSYFGKVMGESTLTTHIKIHKWEFMKFTSVLLNSK